MMTSPEARVEKWNYQLRGHLSARLLSYTEEKSRNYGQKANGQIEQTTRYSSNLNALNQLRWSSNSINTDLSKKNTPSKKESFETYLGENYLKYKSENSVLQIGYQEVIWGEAFGFNYADIIGPKDNRQTHLSEGEEARLPLFLFNGKTFFTRGDFSGSIQLLFSPEPRFSKTLPLDFFIGDTFPQSTMTIIKQKTPSFFKTSEVGGKLSASYAGFDVALFNYTYLTRDPYYSLESATLQNITIKEEHNKIQSTGFSFAKSIGGAVLRSDMVLTKNKMINYISNMGAFTSFSTSSLNTLVSIDTPTYKNFSGVLIYAKSSLADIVPNAFRRKNEEYFIGKISKNLGSDKILDIAYIRELETSGQSLQPSMIWPVNASSDIKFGGEFYFGDDQSNLKKLKNINNVFISFKNYFSL